MDINSRTDGVLISNSPQAYRSFNQVAFDQYVLTLMELIFAAIKDIDILSRFLKKNLPFQDIGAGLIKMSYLGNSGWRCNRSSTACIAALPSEMPFWYTLRLSSTTG